MKKQQRTKKRTAGKLELSGETIRILDRSDLGEVVRGGEPTTCSGSLGCMQEV